MKIRRTHLIIAAIILLAITFLVIGVFYQTPPIKYYAHSLRNWQEADSVAGYPIAVGESDEGEEAQFLTTEFQPNLSTMSPMERFRLPTTQGFYRFPEHEARAAGTGLVLYTGNPAGYEGQAILLGHRLPDGRILQTFYYGLSKFSVKVGQQVPLGAALGEGQASLEVREGVAIDIAKEEIDGFLLNSQDRAQAPNRLDLKTFFAEHGLSSLPQDPLAIIQENETQAVRKKLGLD